MLFVFLVIRALCESYCRKQTIESVCSKTRTHLYPRILRGLSIEIDWEVWHPWMRVFWCVDSDHRDQRVFRFHRDSARVLGREFRSPWYFCNHDHDHDRRNLIIWRRIWLFWGEIWLFWWDLIVLERKLIVLGGIIMIVLGKNWIVLEWNLTVRDSI